jgi:hypothetical protein
LFKPTSKPVRVVDRSGAAPRSGVNKGLTVQQRMEDPERSARGRSRSIATNNSRR